MTREEEIEKEANRVSYNGDEFYSFIKGAEWADKTMIDKACKWIEEYLFEVVGLPDDWVRDSTNMLNGEERFRKAMGK